MSRRARPVAAVVAAAAALRDDRRGMALVEFAFTVPILLTAYLGGTELTNAIGCFRKVTTTARAMADLTSQFTVVTNANLADIANASSQVMAPYPSGTKLSLTISQIKIDASRVATVDWSYGKNATALTPGTAVTMDISLRQPSSYILMAKVSYNYQPMFGTGTQYFTARTMTDTIYMSPRDSDFITRN